MEADVNMLSLLSAQGRVQIWARSDPLELAAALLLAENTVASSLLATLEARREVLERLRAQPPTLAACLEMQRQACHTASGLLKAADVQHSEDGWQNWPAYPHDFFLLEPSTRDAWMDYEADPLQAGRRFRECWWYHHRTGVVAVPPSPALGQALPAILADPQRLEETRQDPGALESLLATVRGPEGLRREGMACLADLSAARPHAVKRLQFWLQRL